MAVEFNHTIVWSRNKAESAAFLARILGLPAPAKWGPFAIVATANGVNVDFLEKDGEIAAQHYAFLVSDAEFDQIFGRIQKEGLTYWADPAQTRAGEINHHDGGRGVYFTESRWPFARSNHAALRQRRLEPLSFNRQAPLFSRPLPPGAPSE